MKELSEKDRKKIRERNMDLIDIMIGELKRTRTAIEYEKTREPYFYLFVIGEGDKINTHTLSNLDLFSTIGLMESFKINNLINKK